MFLPEDRSEHTSATFVKGLADEHPEMDAISPKTVGGTSVSLHVYVEDADAVFERAIEASTKALRRCSVRSLHPAWRARPYQVRQRPRVCSQGCARVDYSGARAKTAYIALGSPWENGYVESFNARLRDELLDGEIFYTLREAQMTRHRELAASLQHDQAACIARLQATSPRGVRACIRRVAGCATSTSFASHASTEAGLELTLHLDHPMGSHQWGHPRIQAWFIFFG